MDYGVNGSVKDISVSGNTMKITVEEDGKTMTSTINYIDDYSPEQLYNIWQEFPDNDSSNEMQSAEKITSSMGISPDEAKAFVSGKGSLTKGGYEGVSNVKSAPTFEYKSNTGYEKVRSEKIQELMSYGYSQEESEQAFEASVDFWQKQLKCDRETAMKIVAKDRG